MGIYGYVISFGMSSRWLHEKTWVASNLGGPGYRAIEELKYLTENVYVSSIDKANNNIAIICILHKEYGSGKAPR